eukprot:COSAG05_NODE_239_length_13139_cov_14.870475_16_plen_98_part_01
MLRPRDSGSRSKYGSTDTSSHDPTTQHRGCAGVATEPTDKTALQTALRGYRSKINTLQVQLLATDNRLRQLEGVSNLQKSLASENGRLKLENERLHAQ